MGKSFVLGSTTPFTKLTYFKRSTTCSAVILSHFNPSTPGDGNTLLPTACGHIDPACVVDLLFIVSRFLLRCARTVTDDEDLSAAELEQLLPARHARGQHALHHPAEGWRGSDGRRLGDGCGRRRTLNQLVANLHAARVVGEVGDLQKTESAIAALKANRIGCRTIPPELNAQHLALTLQPFRQSLGAAVSPFFRSQRDHVQRHSMNPTVSRIRVVHPLSLI